MIGFGNRRSESVSIVRQNFQNKRINCVSQKNVQFVPPMPPLSMFMKDLSLVILDTLGYIFEFNTLSK